MSSRPNRAIVLRWIFLLAGLFLLFGGGMLIGFQTVVRQFATIFLGYDGRQNRTVLAFAVCFPLVTSGFCLITAQGLRLGRNWARLTGICASFLLIGLFSWLSLAGFWCLWSVTRPLKVPETALPSAS